MDVTAMIEIDPTARVSRLADIEDSIRGTRIVVGPMAVIDSFVKIKPVGGSGDVVIGERSYLNSGTVIYSGNGVMIGKGVLISANCTLAPVNHAFERVDLMIIEQSFQPSRGGIIIEDDVWIGANSVLLDGATIRRGAVVAAGSVVRHELEAFGVYAGTPLRLIKKRNA
jgi:acetyltransferase-like isoleucine patch superfamily enzyme